MYYRRVGCICPCLAYHFSLLLLVLAGVMYPCAVAAQSAPVFTYNGNSLSVGKDVLILKDNTNKLMLQDVVNSRRFEAYQKQVVNLGVSTAGFWFRFSVKNSSQEDRVLLLLDQPHIEIAELYTKAANGQFTVAKSGTSLPVTVRDFYRQELIYDLHLHAGEEKEYFLKIKSAVQLIVPIKIGSPETIFQALMNKDLLFGIFFGIVCCMFFYNIFIYCTVRDRIYIYYIVYILTVILAQCWLAGYAFKYLWPGNLWLVQNGLTLFSDLGSISAVAFIQQFLQTKKHLPKLHLLLNCIVVCFIVSLILMLTGEKQLGFLVMQACTLPSSVVPVVTAIVSVKRGLRTAKFFLFSWLFLCTGGAVLVLKDYGFFPVNAFTTDALQIGFSLEVILLGFALADKINIYKKEKEKVQAESIQLLQERDKLITEQNITLETKIQERTWELQAVNQNLTTTMNHLKDAQTQLVASEKMASLGQLTAGIAHEINNPINFVKSNIKPLQADVQELFELIDNCLEMHCAASPGKHVLLADEAVSIANTIDTAFLKTEINELISGIEEGAIRTADIVKHLRNFSRLDESDVKLADVQEGIANTLLLLKSQIPSHINIITQFGADQEIECYAGLMNQVFMNLLINSIQAIKAKPVKENEYILITTKEVNDCLEICVQDSGIGMSKEVQRRIFEPFFTTKEIGEGTGLGMSIAFKIIEKHNGSIAINSTPGYGTTITLSLPYTGIAGCQGAFI